METSANKKLDEIEKWLTTRAWPATVHALEASAPRLAPRSSKRATSAPPPWIGAAAGAHSGPRPNETTLWVTRLPYDVTTRAHKDIGALILAQLLD